MLSVPLTFMDLVVIAILLISGALAFFRGFVHEVLSIGGWIGAGFAALYGYPFLRPFTRDIISVGWAADATAAIGIFLVTLVLLSLTINALSSRVQGSCLNSLDRALGFLFGLARAGVIVALLFIATSAIYPKEEGRPKWIADARTLPFVEAGAEVMKAAIPDHLRDPGERARSLIATGQNKAQKALALKKLHDKLLRPEPAATGSHPGPAIVPPSESGGYDSVSSDHLDQLFQEQEPSPP